MQWVYRMIELRQGLRMGLSAINGEITDTTADKHCGKMNSAPGFSVQS